MLIASAAVLGFGILAAWTLIYHMAFVLKRIDRKHLLITVAALLVAVAPLTAVLYSHTQSSKAMDQALSNFTSEYPAGQLLLAEQLDDVWVYSYVEDNKQRAVLRIGESWLTVSSQQE